MKGYKTLADGRKTSFFHMEVSEEAKKLQEAQGLMKAGGNKACKAFLKEHDCYDLPQAQRWASKGAEKWRQKLREQVEGNMRKKKKKAASSSEDSDSESSYDRKRRKAKRR